MKGQYFSFDAIIGAVIFVLALVALLSYWHSVRSFLDYQNDPLTHEAMRISDNLFLAPSPSTDCQSMSRFGLAMGTDDRRLSAKVIACASAQGQGMTWFQKVLGTGDYVVLNITDTANGNSITIPSGAAVPASLSVANVVKIRRLATVYNDSDGSTYLASVDMEIFQNQSG